MRDQKSRIDACEHIVLVDLLALGEDDLHDLPADAGFDGNGVVRLDDADTLQCNGYIPAFGGYHITDAAGAGGRPRGFVSGRCE